jgi:large subunit ribosomal protein L18
MNDIRRRKKRALRIRSKISKIKSFRVSVHRTSQHIYVQLFSEDCSVVLHSASSLESAIRDNINLVGKTGIEIAFAVGLLFAERLRKTGFGKLSFDRSGFKYHGRIKSVVSGMLQNGIYF